MRSECHPEITVILSTTTDIRNSPGARRLYVSPPGGGKRHSVFLKVIGCPDHSRMPPFISGELFGLRVENKNYIYFICIYPNMI